VAGFYSASEKKKERKKRGRGLKKDQTLRLSKVLGEVFVEGPSRFYIAAAGHVAKGEIISGIREHYR
jgi:hypothetical protein